MPEIGYVAFVVALLLIAYCFAGSFQKCNHCGGWNAHVGLCDDCLEKLVAEKLARDEAAIQKLGGWRIPPKENT